MATQAQLAEAVRTLEKKGYKISYGSNTPTQQQPTKPVHIGNIEERFRPQRQSLVEQNIYGRANTRKSAFVERVSSYNWEQLADLEQPIDERKIPQMLADLGLLWAFKQGWMEER